MRKYIDCRSQGDGNCTVAIAADKDEELVEAAMEHMTKVHHMRDTPELRKDLKSMMKSGSPPP
jgi:predicted small metal-binding protein